MPNKHKKRTTNRRWMFDNCTPLAVLQNRWCTIGQARYVCVFVLL